MGVGSLARAGALAVLIGMMAAPAALAEGPMRIELNKLEPAKTGCTAYMMFQNQTGQAHKSFKIDLVMFDPDGVVNERVALDGGPLAVAKTRVLLFDIADIPCDRIGRVLLNDVLACGGGGDGGGGGDVASCLAASEPSARGKVPFIK